MRSSSTTPAAALPRLPVSRAAAISIALLTTIALLALGVRLLTFDRYLPFMDYGDESDDYLLARDWRGVEDVPVVPEWLAGYPPLYVWINMGVQQVIEANWMRPWIFPSEYLYYLRLLAAIFGWLTTLVIMRLGWQLGGAVAAVFAGAVWALSPLVVDYNSLAIPDPLVYLCCAVALVTAMEGWRSKSPLWLLVSLAAAIGATYAKYSAVFILFPWGIVTLVLARQQPRRWWYWLLSYGVVAAASAGYLVFGYGALRLSGREATSVRGSNLTASILNLDIEVNNWYHAILPMGVAVFVIVVGLGLIAYSISRKRGWQTIRWSPLIVILITALVGIAITTTYTYVALPAGKIRHSLPITVGLIGLWAANIAQIYWTLRDWGKSGGYRRAAWLPAAFLIGLGVVVSVPLVTGSAQSIQTFNLTATRLLAQRYADASLPDDGMILMHNRSHIEALFNPPYNGYSGSTSFRWWLEDPAGSTPQEMAERGMAYFVLGSEDWNRYADQEGVRRFIDQLTPLRTIHATEGTLGPDISFYRILPPKVSIDVPFGDQLHLAGYDLTTNRVAAGASFTLRPYWRASSTPAINYSMFLHLFPVNETTLITQADGTPALATHPATTWDDPQELIIGNDFTLTVPPETPPGDYTLALGMYDYGTGQRLQTPFGDHFQIPITVVE